MFERLVWLVPLAVALTGFRRPRAGLLVLAAALPFFGSPPGGPYLAALDVAGLAAILTGWRGARAPATPLSRAAAAFVVVGLASLVPLLYLPPSFRPSVLLGLLQALPGVEAWPALYTWRAAADLLLGWGLFLTVRRAFAGRSARPLALALLVGLLAALLLALAARTGLVDLNGYRPQLTLLAGRSRLASVFFLSGWFSEYLVIATPLAVAGLDRLKRWWWPAAVTVLGLSLACLALTHQRGAWVAAAAQVSAWVAVVAWRQRIRWRRLGRAAVTAAAAVALALTILLALGGSVQPVMERGSSVSSGFSTRTPLWATATEMFRERPLLGWGLGSFVPAYDLHHPRGSADARQTRGTAHSLYFHVAAERGLLGLLALGLLGLAAVACLRRPRRGQEALVLGLGVALAGAATYGLVQYLFHLRSISWLLWIVLGCVAVSTRPGTGGASMKAARVLMLAALLLVPIRALTTERAPSPSSRQYGFHEAEGQPDGRYRWTEGRAALRLPRAGDTLVLSLANGHPRGGRRPVDVVIAVDGEVLARPRIAGHWEEHRFTLGPAERDWVVLTLEARPTFRPFSDYRRYSDLPRARDIRSLGIAVRDIHWEQSR